MSGTRKVAVVTGAAQGFGRAISIGLARSGVDVVAVDLAEAKETTAAVERFGVRGASLVADVSAPASAEALAQLLRDQFGRCDILVNNAGIYPNKPIDDAS
ncbi:SDR family NAD(P)-dependent oxidoreductase [Streptomyces sp. NPDC054919]